MAQLIIDENNQTNTPNIVDDLQSLFVDVMETFESHEKIVHDYIKVNKLNENIKVSLEGYLSDNRFIYEKIRSCLIQKKVKIYAYRFEVFLISSMHSSYVRKFDEFINGKNNDYLCLISFVSEFQKIYYYFLNHFNSIEIEDNKFKAETSVNEVESLIKNLNEYIAENKILSADLKNRTIKQIYDSDANKHRWTARFYEFLFFSLIGGLIYYFFVLEHKFNPELSGIFYMQKVSLLIISTSVGAFLLKRTFMNRKLADETERTAKEIDGLPRYMNGLPNELQEKIRFDLAYKYFGAGVSNESYREGENLMHENIKANTEFLKSVKKE